MFWVGCLNPIPILDCQKQEPHVKIMGSSISNFLFLMFSGLFFSVCFSKERRNYFSSKKGDQFLPMFAQLQAYF